MTEQTQEPRIAAFEAGEVHLIASLCETAVDLLRGKMIMGEVPDAHLSKVNEVCKRGDAVVEKLLATLPDDWRSHDGVQ